MKVIYRSNNSGGDWWLSDSDWYALEEAGWKVEWVKDNKGYNRFSSSEDGRWLGALATKATREGVTLGQAIAEWERITGQDHTELGCRCCGCPHVFSEYDDNGKYLKSYLADLDAPTHAPPYEGD